MGKTYQIRKYLEAAAAAALCAGLLIGCTRADSSTGNAAAGAGNPGVNASGNVVAGAGNQGVTGTSSADQTAQSVQGQADTGAGSQTQTAQAGNSQNVQTVSGTTSQTQQSTAPASAQPAEPSAKTQPAEAADEDGQEEFTGRFVRSDGEEAVRLVLESDQELTFTFRTSAINGSAKVEGNTALYHGDDGYTITFDVAEDMLVVTVDGEGAEQSVMNGIYYRSYGDEEDSDQDSDSVYDADETEDWEDEE